MKFNSQASRITILSIAILLVIFLLLFITVGNFVLAADPPDSLDINGTYAYQDLQEDGDQLFLIDLSINDSTPPTNEFVSELYLVRLLDGATELASVAPYTGLTMPPDNGHARQVVGIYFDADNAVTWSGNYTIQLAGNPTANWSTLPTPITSGIDYWSMAGSMQLAHEELSTRILNEANSLSANWSLALTVQTSAGTKLSTDGQEYFTAAINNLQVMAPYAFQGMTTQPEWPTENKTMDYSANLTAGASGTPLDLTALGTTLGVSGGVVSSVLFTIGLVLFLGLVVQATGGNKIIIVISTPAVLAATLTGFIPLMTGIFLGLMALFSTGYVLFYSKSSA